MYADRERYNLLMSLMWVYTVVELIPETKKKNHAIYVVFAHSYFLSIFSHIVMPKVGVYRKKDENI